MDGAEGVFGWISGQRVDACVAHGFQSRGVVENFGFRILSMEKNAAWELDPAGDGFPGFGIIFSYDEHGVLLIGLRSIGSIFFPKNNNDFAAGFDGGDTGLFEGGHHECDSAFAASGAGESCHGRNEQGHKNANDGHDGEKLEQ
jgi:hypothetical protein